MTKITKKAGARAYYTIDKDYKKIELLKRKCPRCNSLMADHYDRYACGKCGFTNFKAKDEKTKGKKTSTKAIEEVEEEEEMD